MKLKVAICEDNPGYAGKIREIAEHTLFSKVEYEFVQYENGTDLIQDVENGNFHSNLILLDIHMESMNGLETVEWIRKYKVDVDVIFVTVAQEYVYQCYIYKAFAYILKSDMEYQLKDALNRYVDELMESSDYLNVDIRGSKYRIPINDVLYFESNGRKLIAHLLDENIEFYGKLGEMEELLKDQRFFRCHQSYLVNERYIKAVKCNSVVLRNQEVPISRKYWNSYRQSEERNSE